MPAAKRKMAQNLFVRSVVFKPLLEHFAQDLGGLRSIFHQNGVPFAIFEDPYTPIPLHSYLNIFEKAAELCGDPALGARLGLASRPGNIAPIGLLAAQLSTIRRALEAMARYLTALQSGTQMTLECQGDELTLSYRIIVPIKASFRQDAEFTLASTCGLIRSVFDMRWRPLEIHFSHAAPIASERNVLRKLFSAPVRFAQATNRIILSRADAQRIHRAEDKDMIEMIERHLMDLIQRTRSPASITEQVEELVDLHLGIWRISAASIAEALQMSPRNLQRRLAEENQTLSGVIQRHRQMKADTLLADGSMSIETIASALGYADGTAFWRAYRSWTGHSPRQRPKG